MELIQVALVTASLLLALAYYTVFPTLMNFAISFVVVMALAKNNGFMMLADCGFGGTKLFHLLEHGRGFDYIIRFRGNTYAVGCDRNLKTNTVKRRRHSLFRQGGMIYDLLPNMPDKWLQPSMQKFGAILCERRSFSAVFALYK